MGKHLPSNIFSVHAYLSHDLSWRNTPKSYFVAYLPRGNTSHACSWPFMGWHVPIIFGCVFYHGVPSLNFPQHSAVRGVTRSHHFQLSAWGNTSQMCVWTLWIVVFIEGCTCVDTCGLDRRDKYAHNVWSFSVWRNVYVRLDKGRCVHEISPSSSLGNVYAFVCKWPL